MWGGGIYQPSDELTGGYDFYSACDELGIFAWSEFIFSDTLYPINEFMLETYEPEVRQNIRRVNRHPSNAQWAGGNEIEGIVISVNETLANGTHYLDEVRTARTPGGLHLEGLCLMRAANAVPNPVRRVLA